MVTCDKKIKIERCLNQEGLSNFGTVEYPMSFNKPFSDDLESASVKSTHYKDFPQFDHISQSIDSLLHNINSKQLISLRDALQGLESLKEAGPQQLEALPDSSKTFVELSSKCTETFKEINKNMKELNNYLRECEASHEDEDTLKYMRQKEAISLSSIKTSLSQYQSYQKRFRLLDRGLISRLSANTEAVAVDQTMSPAPSSGPEQIQYQIAYEPVNAEELEQQTLLIEEREREIQQIAQDTREINEIFSNLQDIVQEQQIQIDTIEDNILSYSTDAQAASRELRRAERYQKRSCGRMLCCLIILVGVFGSVIFISIIF